MAKEFNSLSWRRGRGILRALPLLILPFLFACSGNGEDGNTASRKESSSKEEGIPAKYHRDSLSAKLKSLNKAIREAPQNPELYFERSLVKERLGKLSAAVDDIDRALRIDSTRSRFHRRKGELHFRKQEVKPAIHHYRKAIALDGDNTKALTGLADLYRATRQYQKAIDYANEALKVDQHLSRPYTIKGLVHLRTGDTSRAVSSLRTTVEMDPENHSAFLQLGYLMALKDNDMAIDYYNRAHKIQPEDPRPIYDKGIYLQEHGRPDQAIETYKELIHIDTGYVDAYYNIGYIHLVHKKQYRKAIEWFNKAIDLAPRYHQAIYNRGLCYENLGKRDSAIMDFRSALNIKNGDYKPAARGLQRLEAEYRSDE